MVNELPGYSVQLTYSKLIEEGGRAKVDDKLLLVPKDMGRRSSRTASSKLFTYIDKTKVCLTSSFHIHYLVSSLSPITYSLIRYSSLTYQLTCYSFISSSMTPFLVLNHYERLHRIKLM